MNDFLSPDKPLLTVMLQSCTVDGVLSKIRGALALGAEAFGLQIERLPFSDRNEKAYRRIFAEGGGLPFYVTSYRSGDNKGRTDDELADDLLLLADSGASLCDVMGDLYSKHPLELTGDPSAIEKQTRLIDSLHEKGAAVLMSSHTHTFLPPERVLEFALEQKRRGADFIKIVTNAADDDEQLQNLAATRLLKKELGAPFLFLSGGECTIHRRIGWKLGCSMILCVYEHDELSTKAQPLLSVAKAVRDEMGF